MNLNDILLIILAFSIVWITILVSWFILQVAMVFKKLNDVLDAVKSKVNVVDDTLSSIKQKFHEGTENLGKLTDNVKEYVSGLGKK